MVVCEIPIFEHFWAGRVSLRRTSLLSPRIDQFPMSLETAGRQGRASPDPEQPEAVAVPGNDGFELDDARGRLPIVPNLDSYAPGESIGWRQSRAHHRAMQNIERVP